MRDPKCVCDHAHLKIGSEGGQGMRKTLNSLQDRHPSNFLYSRGGMTPHVDLRPLLESLSIPRMIRWKNMEQRWDDYGLRNTVLREKTYPSDTCQPPVPRWLSCNWCQVLTVRSLNYGTQSMYTLSNSFSLSTGQYQCPQDIEYDSLILLQ